MYRKLLTIMLLLIMLLSVTNGCITIASESHTGTENNIEISFETSVGLQKRPAANNVTSTPLQEVSPTSAATDVIIQPSVTQKPTGNIPQFIESTTIPLEIADSKKIEMRLVPAGEFIIGSDLGETDERPSHRVYLDAYYIDKYEVTNAAYRVCVEAGKCLPPANSKKYNSPLYDQHPVVFMTWSLAESFCEWRLARLPTEAEWEKAARGTDGRTYPWGEGIDYEHANYDLHVRDTVPVGSYPEGVSPYVVYDMTGNVWEWVADWYAENYYRSYAADTWIPNPPGPKDGLFRGLRGGAWDSTESFVRSASRSFFDPLYDNEKIGFRCALTAFLPLPTTNPTVGPSVATRSVSTQVNNTQSTQVSSADGTIMVYIPAGNFTMGSDNEEYNEKPVHTVYLDDYYIDKYEVTNALYKVCVAAGVCQPPRNINSSTSGYYQLDNYPVIYVDWNMAKTYCQWRGASLPTEAQWEKAARGTDGRIYPWGDSIDSTYANYMESARGGATAVGSYTSDVSFYGAFDMAGNVWEWVMDWYLDIYYKNSPSSNPTGPSSGDSHVIRGGSWHDPGISVSSANRDWTRPTDANDSIGFRCALTASP